MKNFVFAFGIVCTLLAGLCTVAVAAVNGAEIEAVAAAVAAAPAGLSFAVVMPGVFSQDYYRWVYDMLLQKLQSSNQFAGAQLDDWRWRIQEGEIRSDVQLTAGKTSYVFPIVNNSGNEEPQENLLNQSDTFYVVEHGILLKFTNEDNQVYLTSYPSAVLGGAGVNQMDILTSIYQGKLNITDNRNVVRENVLLNRFLHVPEVQQGATPAGVGAADGPVYASNLDSGSPLNGLQRTIPQISFNGTGKNEVRVDFPSAPGTIIPSGTRKLDLVYYAKGFYLRGINVNL